MQILHKMTKAIPLFLLLIWTSLICPAQSASDSIVMKQRLGKVFLQHNKVLPASELHAILSTSSDGTKEVEQAKANLAPLYIFSFAGGFLIGWPIGTAIGRGKPNWALAAGGVGLVLCAIPFQAGYNKHILKAITIYNKNLKKIGMQKPILEVGWSRTGIGVEVRF